MRIKNVLNVLLLSGITLGTLSTVTSCKDYDDDIAGLKSDLTAEVSAREALEKKVEAAEKAIADLQGAVKTLQADVKKNTEDIATNAAAIVALQNAQKALENALKEYATKKELKDAVDELNNKIDTEIAKAVSDLNAALNLKADKKDVEEIQKMLSDIEKKYGKLPEAIEKITKDIEKLKTALEAQEKALEEAKKAIADGDAATLEAANKAIKDAMDEVAKIYATKAEVSEISKQITNILNVVIPEVEKKVAAVDAKVEVINKILSNKLRSLVFQPFLYVDGIEAIEYPYYVDTTLVLQDKTKITREARKAGSTYFVQYDGYSYPDKRNEVEVKELKNFNDYVKTSASKEFWVCPNWPVTYHMNPSTSSTEYKDIKGFYVLETTVITRANIANDYKQITSPQYYLDGDKNDTELLFNNSNGILTAGININEASLKSIVREHSDEAQSHPGTVYPHSEKDGSTGKISYGKDNIVALQVQSRDNGTKDTLITSDYAMLYPEKIDVEGIIWMKYPGKKKLQLAPGHENDIPNYCEMGKTKGDEKGKEGHWEDGGLEGHKGNNGCDQQIHVWNTPEEALLQKDLGNLVELEWDDKNGIKLEDYLGIHVTRETVESKVSHAGKTWEKLPFVQTAKPKADALTMKRLGLTYDFELVYYTVKDATSDSHYAAFTDIENGMSEGQKSMATSKTKKVSKTGTIIAGNVDDKAKPVKFLEEQSEASIDREPLVRVRVWHNNDVILDGYILVHICRKAIPEPTKEINLPTEKVTFDLCNALQIYELDWAEWSKWILTDDMKVNGKSMTEEEFKYYFEPEGVVTTANYDGENGDEYTMTLFEKNGTEFKPITMSGHVYDDDQWGVVTLHWNEAGVKNNQLFWNMTEQGLEYNLHGGKKNQIHPESATKEVYVRFNRKAGTAAPYRFVYMKLSTEIIRKQYTWSKLTDKNNTYWYTAWAGSNGAGVAEGIKADGAHGSSAEDSKAEAYILNNWTPMNEKCLRHDDTYWPRQILAAFDANTMYAGAGTNSSKVGIQLNGTGNLKPDYNKLKYFFLPIDVTVKEWTVKAAYMKPDFDAANAATHKYPVTPNLPTGICPVDGTDCPVTYNLDWSDNKMLDRMYCKYHQHTNVINCICDKHGLMAGGKTPWQTANYKQHTSTNEVCTCNEYHTLGLKTYAQYAAGTFADMKKDVEKKFNDVLSTCAIDYDKGVFMNNVLIASKDGSNWTIIAHMNQVTGQIDLAYNDVTKTIINLIAWSGDMTTGLGDRKNIDEELRAMVAVARPNNCGVVMQATDNEFQVSWERPLHVNNFAKEALDAKTNANIIYIGEDLQIFDFRGPKHGDLSSESTVWQWAFYNLERIDVDLRGSSVYTDQDGSESNWVKWSDRVAVLGELYADYEVNAHGEIIKGVASNIYKINYLCPETPVAGTCSCGEAHMSGVTHTCMAQKGNKTGFCIYDYNCADKSPELWSIMTDPAGTHMVTGTDGKNYDLKAAFGVIVYDNNGNNTRDFNIRVPVTMHYYWGSFTTIVQIHVNGTAGNNN